MRESDSNGGSGGGWRGGNARPAPRVHRDTQRTIRVKNAIGGSESLRVSASLTSPPGRSGYKNGRRELWRL